MPCCNCVVIKTIFHKKTNVACKNGLWNCFVSLLTLYLLSIISLFHDTRLFKLTFRVTFRYVASLVQVVFVSHIENIVTYSYVFFLKNAYFHLFSFFINTLQTLQQIGMWKNVPPVYGAGIPTHDLWNMNLHP